MYGTEKDVKHVVKSHHKQTADRGVLCCGCCRDLALAGFGPRVGPQRGV